MKIINNLLLCFALSAFVSSTLAASGADTKNNNKIVEDKAVPSPDQIKIDEETLSNGLRIIVVHLNTNGAVTAGVGYHVGSVDDPRDVVGISHFLEHMMFKGTKNINGDKLKEIMDKFNKVSNAFTDHDITCYHYSCNKAFLDVGLKIEADRMQNLLLKKSDIAKEKEVIIEERKMRMESDPRMRYKYESAIKSMFLYSNYSYPVIGYLDQIKNCDKKALQKHYDKFYRPNNAFVLIVGDITKEEAVIKVKKYFGSIKTGEKITREIVVDPKETGLTYAIDHQSKQISTHDLDLVFQVDRSLINNMKKYMTIEIAANILAGGSSSILYENIVDKKELSYNLDSQLDIRSYDNGKFSVSTVYRENTNDIIVEKEIKNIVEQYANKYLTKELVEKEKKKTLNQIELMKDNPDSMFMYCISNLVLHRTKDEIKDVSNIIKSITFEEVQKAAEKLVSRNIMRIHSHPES